MITEFCTMAQRGAVGSGGSSTTTAAATGGGAASRCLDGGGGAGADISPPYERMRVESNATKNKTATSTSQQPVGGNASNQQQQTRRAYVPASHKLSAPPLSPSDPPSTAAVRPIKQSVVIPPTYQQSAMLHHASAGDTPPLDSRTASTDDGFDDDHELLVVQLPHQGAAAVVAAAAAGDGDLPPEVASLNAQWRSYAAARCGVGGRGLPGAPFQATTTWRGRPRQDSCFASCGDDDECEFAAAAGCDEEGRDDYDADDDDAFRPRRRTITSRFPVPNGNGNGGGGTGFGGTPSRRMLPRQRKFSQGDNSIALHQRLLQLRGLEQHDESGGGCGSIADEGGGAAGAPSSLGDCRRHHSSPERSLLSANYAFLRRSVDHLGLEIVAAFDKCHLDAYRHFLQSLTCYDMAPPHGMVVMFDANLPIRKAVIALCSMPPSHVAIICNIAPPSPPTTATSTTTTTSATTTTHHLCPSQQQQQSVGSTGSADSSASSTSTSCSSSATASGAGGGGGGAPNANGDLALFSVTDCLRVLKLALAEHCAASRAEASTVAEPQQPQAAASIADATLNQFLERAQPSHRRRGLISVDATTTAWDLARMFMLNRVHRIPVFDGAPECGAEILAVLCPRAICAELLKLIDHTAPKCQLVPNLKEIELGARLLGTWHDIATVYPRTPCSRAIDLLLEQRVTSLPVIEPTSGAIIGKVDKTAIVEALATYGLDRSREVLDMQVQDIMQLCPCSDLLVVPPETSVAECCRLLVEDGFRESVFVGSGDTTRRLLGVVTHIDIIGFLLNAGGTPEASPTPASADFWQHGAHHPLGMATAF